MPVLRLPGDAWGKSPGRTLKRKRSHTKSNVAINTDGQSDRFKRPNNHDGPATISMTESNGIINALDSVTTESNSNTSTIKSQPSLLPTPLLVLQSSQAVSIPSHKQVNNPNDQGTSPQKWNLKDWDGDEFESDEENMSLAVTMKLANELSLLKSFVQIYKKFNIHLGDIVSGPRHRGFLSLISSTVTRLESHTTHLCALRNDRQRGHPTPSAMEVIAEKISRRFRTRVKDLWSIMEEKVDMVDDVARAVWVRKKKAVLGDVMGGMVGVLEELGEEEGWKEREVREMGERWEKRWKMYGAMDREDLKRAGWILEVGKRDDRPGVAEGGSARGSEGIEG